MFGIGMQELMIILVVALIFIGPSKLPEVARTIGKGLREVRKASDDLRSTIMLDDVEPPTPPRAPLRTLPPPRNDAVPIDAEVTPAIHGSLTVVAEGAVSRGGSVQGDIDPNDATDHHGMPSVSSNDDVNALIADARMRLEKSGALSRQSVPGEQNATTTSADAPVDAAASDDTKKSA
jgi:sec-independent protein translocase protein TatA